jgi:hypothetical protein
VSHRWVRAAGISACIAALAAGSASAETLTYATPGTTPVTLPTGVARVHVVAVGGRGGGAAGGFGAVVSGDVGILSPDVPETSPRLLIRVAGNGGIGVGGFNGGGPAGFDGLSMLPTFAGGGGGASTMASLTRVEGNFSFYLNQVLAAGGGGAGAPSLLGGADGAGGSAGATGGAGTSISTLTAAGGGSAGAVAGSAGGIGSVSNDLDCGDGEPGEDGASRAGGAGGLSADASGHGDGGGGGSGSQGGGGGGGGGFCRDDTGTSGGGGGGGSSNVPAGGAIATDATGQPYVQITYTLEQPTVEITMPTDGAVFKQGRPIPASYTCAAPAALPRDTIASCTGTVASGEDIDASTPGDNELSVTATDAYGLTATQTVHYLVADHTPPAVRGLVVKPRSIDASAPHAFALVSFRLSERARVLIRVRRVGGSTSRARDRRARAIAGTAGWNDFKLRARTGRRTLRAGAYRLTLVAVDRAGNRSRAAAARFSVVD